MEMQEKPLCKFGDKCYRKNPKHLESYFHPPKITVAPEKGVLVGSPKKTQAEPKRKNNSKQEVIKFLKLADFSSAASSSVRTNVESQSVKKELHSSSPKRRKIVDKGEKNFKTIFERESKIVSKEGCDEKVTKVNSNACVTSDTVDDGNRSCESAPNTFSRENANEAKHPIDLNSKTTEEIIKALFLVDMPPDFYSFHQFCESIEESSIESLMFGQLNLVGPFDVLSGKIKNPVNPDLYLCHWRFYYDPPEFQTVMAAESGYHIGYWRDNPKENPVFVASNSNKDCIYKIEAENLFGAVFHYLDELKSDPFTKAKTSKLQQSLKNWAERNNFTLDRKSTSISSRQKKVVSKTFHTAGIVVPVDSKTELGYRPLIETNARLKNICKLIIKADDDNERESLWENLQPLITAANIANDECDFGNGLELGIDLFCMGSPVFHETVEQLLTVAYSLLNRTEFEKIIQAHLKYRRKENDLALLC